MRMFLKHLFNADPELMVVGSANNGIEAIAEAERLVPNIITMDTPHARTLIARCTWCIMETRPIPIISAVLDTAEVVSSFRAMEAGAVAALPKPRGAGHPDHDGSRGSDSDSQAHVGDKVRGAGPSRKGGAAFHAAKLCT